MSLDREFQRRHRVTRSDGPKSYDHFLAGRSRATGLQFVGLLVLGTFFTGTGTGVFIAVASRLRGYAIGVVVASVLFVALIICGSIVYLGLLHFRRAFEGRR